jgi:NADH dehydrogenase [ubiquinone] 1 alpha subcomplex assembly factor 7
MPAADESLGPSTVLADALRRAAGPDGLLPFDRFQEIVLYEPEVGYYTQRGRRLGREGDFYTAAHVTRLFGETIADRIRAEWVRQEEPARFRVVELGPGDGTLARDVVSALAEMVPSSGAWEYVLVERSEPLRRQALERLRDQAGRRDRLVVRAAPSLGAEGPFPGFVLGNEFLDALPVRRFVRREDAWRELYVDVGRPPWRWVEEPARRPVPGPPLPTDGPPESVVEISPIQESVMREVADHLTRGAAVFLDYGLEEGELVRRGPSGTLAAVRRHLAETDPLAHPGESDLSAFVNFTRVRRAAREAGLREIAYRPQAEALGAWGLPARLDRALEAAASEEAKVRDRLAVKNLLFGFPTFRALELGAGDEDAAATPSGAAEPPRPPAPRSAPG